MAVWKYVSFLVFGVLVAATSLRCASAFSYSDDFLSPTVAGFHGHELSVESADPYRPTKEHFLKVNATNQGGVRSVDDHRPPQPNPPIHVNPPAQVSAVDEVDQPQLGSSQSPDIHDDLPPAAWSLNKGHACMTHYQCSEPTPVCLNGRCVRPPQVFRSNNNFNRGGAVLPTSADKGNKGFNRGGVVLPTNVDRVHMGFNRGGAVLPGWML